MRTEHVVSLLANNNIKIRNRNSSNSIGTSQWVIEEIFKDIENLDISKQNDLFFHFDKNLMKDDINQMNNLLLEKIKFIYPIDYYSKYEKDILMGFNITVPGFRIGSEMLVNALKEGKRVLALTDYDCDGAFSAGSISKLFCKYYDKDKIDVFINKRRFGNGINPPFIEYLEKEKSINLNDYGVLLTADHGCGSIPYLLEIKDKYPHLKVIITDHHEVPMMIPESYNKDVIIVNAHIPTEDTEGSRYPIHRYRKLSGCTMVSMFLVDVFSNYKGNRTIESTNVILGDIVDYIAITVVSDVMDVSEPLNRYFFKLGMCKINTEAERNFIYNMNPASGLHKDIMLNTIRFTISPVINSCNRFHEEGLLEELLVLPNKIEDVNVRLDKQMTAMRAMFLINNKRKTFTNDIVGNVVSSIENNPETLKSKALSIAIGTNFGINGIIAGKLSELFKRPSTCFIKGEDGLYHGSLRSTDVNLLEILNKLKEEGIVIKYGGHKQACGCSIKVEDFEKYKKRFNELTPDMKVTKEIEVDFVLPKEKLDVDMNVIMHVLEPFGLGFEEPVIYTEFTFDKAFAKDRIAKGEVLLYVDPYQVERRLGVIGFNNSKYDIRDMFRPLHHVGCCLVFKGEPPMNGIVQTKANYVFTLKPNDEVFSVIE